MKWTSISDQTSIGGHERIWRTLTNGSWRNDGSDAHKSWSWICAELKEVKKSQNKDRKMWRDCNSTNDIRFLRIKIKHCKHCSDEATQCEYILQPLPWTFTLVSTQSCGHIWHVKCESVTTVKLHCGLPEC